MAKNNADASKSRGPGAFKLFLWVVVLLLIPTTMEQLSMHEDTVRLVGRVCAGIGLLIFAYGLLSKVMRFSGLLILILIAARVLANEGVIQVPKLLPKLQAAREEKR